MTANIHPEISDLAVAVDSVRRYGRNARTHDLPLIRESLRVNGQYRPIVVNVGSKTGRENEVLAGNGTHEAAEAEGWDKIAATFVDVGEDAAARIVLVDNRSNDLAAYDDRLLAELLESLEDFAGTGFTDDDLSKLVASLDDDVPDFEPDDDQPSLDEVTPKRCPSCGFEWREDGKGGVTPV